MAMTNKTPPFLIKIAEPGRLGPARGLLHGVRDLKERIGRHLESSVGDQLSPPLLYQKLYRTKESLPDLLCVSMHETLIVSQRLRDAIEPWLKDCEFIPVHVELSLADEDYEAPVGGGPIVENYWWLNSWRRLDIVDWDNSEIQSFPAPTPGSTYDGSPVRYHVWRRLSLHKPPPPDEHFFGFAKIVGNERYLSPALYEHLRAQRFNVKFEPKMLVDRCDKGIYDITQELNRSPVADGNRA